MTGEPLNSKVLDGEPLSDAAVLERERAYHNARFTEETRAAQDKYYAVLKDCDDQRMRLVFDHAKDAVALDYGCARGDVAFLVAPVARRVVGVDISDVAIAIAAQEAAARGLTNTEFLAADAQATPFADGSFDLVFGVGILHHLDTRRALTEIHRILKPGGVAVFREPLGENIAINLYRAITPRARTVDEHPFTRQDFKIAAEVFQDVHWSFHGLCVLAAVPFQGGALGGLIYRAALGLDRLLLRLPGLRWQAWMTLMVLTK